MVERSSGRAGEDTGNDQPAWRRRVMRGGRWVEPAKGTPPAKDDPAAFTVTSVKARRAEIAEFRALCAELAIKPNRAHRAMMRRAAGYLEAGEEEIETLRTLQREIRGIGTNMNQIARVANRTGHADVGALTAEMKELAPALMRLSLQLRTILDTSQRRWDGRERLAKDVATLDREDPSGTGKHGAVARPRTDATGGRKGAGTVNAEPEQRADALSAPQTAGEDRPRRGLLRPMKPFVHPNKQR